VSKGRCTGWAAQNKKKTGWAVKFRLIVPRTVGTSTTNYTVGHGRTPLQSYISRHSHLRVTNFTSTHAISTAWNSTHAFYFTESETHLLSQQSPYILGPSDVSPWPWPWCVLKDLCKVLGLGLALSVSS